MRKRKQNSEIKGFGRREVRMKIGKRMLAMALAAAMTVTMLPESALNIYAMQNGGVLRAVTG